MVCVLEKLLNNHQWWIMLRVIWACFAGIVMYSEVFNRESKLKVQAKTVSKAIPTGL